MGNAIRLYRSYWCQVWALTWNAFKDHYISIMVAYLALPSLDMLMYYQSGRSRASEAVAASMITQMFPLTVTLVLLTLGYIIFIAPYLLHRKDMQRIELERQKCNVLEGQLNSLNEPKISMEFLEITQNPDESDPIHTATLILTGQSQEPQKVELWCSDVKVESPGGGSLEMIMRQPGLKYILHRGEKHRVDAIKYDWKHAGADMQVLIPSKITANNRVRGDRFIVTFVAFGAMNPVELHVACFYSDTYGLQVETVMKQSTVDIPSASTQVT